MTNTKKQAYSKSDKIAAVLVIALMVGLLVVALFLPDGRPEAIRKELLKQGYDVKNMAFEYVMDGDSYREWIYQSSEPVYYDGCYVSQWKLHCFSLSPSSLYVRHFVSPYPPIPEQVKISVPFTAEEYGWITEHAGDDPAEEYIRQKIIDGMREDAP